MWLTSGPTPDAKSSHVWQRSVRCSPLSSPWKLSSFHPPSQWRCLRSRERDHKRPGESSRRSRDLNRTINVRVMGWQLGAEEEEAEVLEGVAGLERFSGSQPELHELVRGGCRWPCLQPSRRNHWSSSRNSPSFPSSGWVRVGFPYWTIQLYHEDDPVQFHFLITKDLGFANIRACSMRTCAAQISSSMRCSKRLSIS